MKAKLPDISFKIGDTVIPVKNTIDIHIYGDGGMTAIEYSGNPSYPHKKIRVSAKDIEIIADKNSI